MILPFQAGTGPGTLELERQDTGKLVHCPGRARDGVQLKTYNQNAVARKIWDLLLSVAKGLKSLQCI